MKHKLRIFSGSSCISFAEEVVKELGISLSACTLKKFSCGENYVKLDESVRGAKVFLIQTIRPGKVHQDLFELFLLASAAKQSFAKTIHLVIPHLAYTRQDKVHEPREPISAKLVAKLLETSGADEVITLDLHSDQNQAFFEIPVDNLNARKLFAEEIKKRKIKNPVVVAPDVGGAKNAKKFADRLGYPLAILHKTRPAHNESEVQHVIGEVEDKTPIIFDDLIDTAGSVAGAKKALEKASANKETYLVATHGVFSGEAEERLKKANFKEILVTNSIPLEGKKIKNLKQISVAPLVGKVIKKIIEDKGVSEILN